MAMSVASGRRLRGFVRLNHNGPARAIAPARSGTFALPRRDDSGLPSDLGLRRTFIAAVQAQQLSPGARSRYQ
jgi:hypothetical protein